MTEGRARRTAMPEKMVAAADAAIARHGKRPAVAPIAVHAEGGEFKLVCPFRALDRYKWEALLFEAFGTRSVAMMQVFMDQLSRLVGTKWNKRAEVWVPSDTELVAAVQMVAGFRVQNEPQAALAAQAVAIHLSMMKLAAYVGGRSHMDERTAATLSRLARTFAQQMDTMHRVQGKRRASKQKIVVKHEKHIHQHVHFEGGAPDFGGQGDASEGQPGVAKLPDAQLAPVPSADPRRNIVQLPGGAGKARLPDARRRSGLGRSEG